MLVPKGAYAPIPTPIGDDGRVELAALARHLEMLRQGGLDGVLIMGTNGEFPSFDIGERLAVAAAAARDAGGLSLMLGVGSCALPEVLRLLAGAHEMGFGAVLVPPPFYFRSAPQAGLTAFFRTVLDAAEVPVLLYNIPQVTGIAVTEALVKALADHPHFAGVKDSSGSTAELSRFCAQLPERAVMVGHDRLLSTALEAGASGSITAAANVVPELVAATSRDPGRQPELDAVRDLLEAYGLGPAVKAILRDRGVGAYRTRPPLVELDRDRCSELLGRLRSLLG